MTGFPVDEKDREFTTSALDQTRRQIDKQASRDKDREDIESGRLSPSELRRRNSMFSVLPLHRYRMAAIGGKPLSPS